MMAVLAAAAAMSGSDFALRSGDRVVFYGDSITEQQRYSAYIEAYVRARLPGLKISFIGAGWAGDTIYGGSEYWDESGGAIDERIAKDIAPRKPTLVTVMLGMNDAYYSPFKQEWLDTFIKDYGSMLDKMKKAAPKARFCLLSPSPWDDFTRPPSFPASVKGEGGYNASLVRYGRAIKEEAAKRKHEFVDVNEGMADALAKAAKEDKETAQQLISDWIHPDWPGALVMAAVMLESWKAPKDVTRVDVDFASGKASAQGAEVNILSGNAWMQRDFALPFPYDPTDKASALGAKSVGLSEKLDVQTLTVKGLKPGTWRLRIGGKTVLDASSDSFANGVSLAGIKTPMRDRSLEVLALVKIKNRLQQARWREVERHALGRFAAADQAVTAMQRLEADVIKQIQAAAKPRWVEWSLSQD